MKKFLKDTRGVVMMEYIILGCFAVAITVVAVLALGKAYNNGLATMSYATLGCTAAATAQQAGAEENLEADLGKAATYAAALAQNGVQENVIDFEVYIPAP